MNLLPFDEGDLRKCLKQTLKALAPEKYTGILLEENFAARTAELQAMGLSELRSLHADECGVRHLRARQPNRRTCVREIVGQERANLKQSTVREVEDLHRKKSLPLAGDEVISRYVEFLWFIDAKIFLREKAKQFEAALNSPLQRGPEINTSLRRWLKAENANLERLGATTSAPDKLSEQQALVEDLTDLLNDTKDRKRGNDAGRIRLTAPERAEFEELWHCDDGISGFAEAVSARKDVDKVHNLHRCYNALHRLIEGARTGVEDWEKHYPSLAALGISKDILRVRNAVRVPGIGLDGKVRGDGRGIRMLERITLPSSEAHSTAYHVVQEKLLTECGKALNVATLRLLLKDTSEPLNWLPDFLLWRTWRRAVEQGRASVYKRRVAFDEEAGDLGVTNDAIQAVRMFLLRCEYGFLHMLNRYPDRTPLHDQVKRALQSKRIVTDSNQ